ncbi:GNAT family N-acetyltransferase [Saccharothrix longispora]|uniref:GNAT family N-acetyltransferase n=1 Tax=Saccharothrix longispora TaxID=33920 RepID=UPI0028FD9F79|nr:GNAT family N-acetyltransferase [Saccharothrix longispora]MBY8848232.1 GNAT family N-acetyltransferase [Saccharothrix sp. MB29]MDU0290263.1 GNAT family N-acetyltransferase [Saccharothrix longispora]
MSRQPHATLRRQWSADLTTGQLYALLALRVDVFVVEQACPYPELDGRDLEPGTRHLWLESAGSPHPEAYLRLLEEPGGGFRIGRVCTARAARGRGHSRRLVDAALVEVGDADCVLDAQTYVVDFYASFGFVPEGAEFIEDGIPHQRMRRSR